MPSGNVALHATDDEEEIGGESPAKGKNTLHYLFGVRVTVVIIMNSVFN